MGTKMDVKNERFWLMQGDCLERMKEIPDGSVDMVLTDPPYGTTACKWDSIIPFEPMWKQLKRVVKPNGAIVMTGRAQFTAKLICSNIKGYKHKWVWNKKQSGSFALAKWMPLQIEEDVIVFTGGGERVNYYPIMRTGKMRKKGGSKKQIETMGAGMKPGYYRYCDQYHPVNIIDIPNCSRKHERVHPTQKPVALMEYLIKTYTNEGETVLDFTAGSFTTGVACINTNRKGIMIEKDPHYFKIGSERVEKAYGTKNRIE